MAKKKDSRSNTWLIVVEDDVCVRSTLVEALLKSHRRVTPATSRSIIQIIGNARVDDGPIIQVGRTSLQLVPVIPRILYSIPYSLADISMQIVAIESKAQTAINTRPAVEVLAFSDIMRNRIEVARKSALASASVMLTGETGTGKGVFAEFIHANSKRATGPFQKVNCGGIPEHLLESELFGHRRGAFTGAIEDRRGRIQDADGGTLFLDEIGELPLSMQPKLLHVLEDKTIIRLGENTPRKVDVRIIAATHQNLRQLVEQGKFREDLYYRVNVITIHLPPLRDRREEILPLAQHFLKMLSPNRTFTFTDNAALNFTAYNWPGNVRELSHSLERAVALADGDLLDSLSFPELHTLPPAVPAQEWKPIAMGKYLREQADRLAGVIRLSPASRSGPRMKGERWPAPRPQTALPRFISLRFRGKLIPPTTRG